LKQRYYKDINIPLIKNAGPQLAFCFINHQTGHWEFLNCKNEHK